jgi:hypothetical protein
VLTSTEEEKIPLVEETQRETSRYGETLFIALLDFADPTSLVEVGRVILNSLPLAARTSEYFVRSYGSHQRRCLAIVLLVLASRTWALC